MTRDIDPMYDSEMKMFLDLQFWRRSRTGVRYHGRGETCQGRWWCRLVEWLLSGVQDVFTFFPPKRFATDHSFSQRRLLKFGGDGGPIVTVSSSTSWEVGRDEPEMDEGGELASDEGLHALWQDLQKALICVKGLLPHFFTHAFHTSCQARQCFTSCPQNFILLNIQFWSSRTGIR